MNKSDSIFKVIIYGAVGILVCCGIFSVIMQCQTHYTPKTDEDVAQVAEANGFAGDYFTELDHWTDYNMNYYIVYAKDTKVKYMIFISGHRFGITPLYNADGSLQLYEDNNSEQGET